MKSTSDRDDATIGHDSVVSLNKRKQKREQNTNKNVDICTNERIKNGKNCLWLHSHRLDIVDI